MANKEEPVIVDKPAPNLVDADDIGHTGDGSSTFKSMAQKLKDGLKEVEGKVQGGTNTPKFGHEAPKLEKKTKEEKSKPTPAKTESKADPEPAKKPDDVAPHVKTITGKKADDAPSVDESGNEAQTDLDDPIPENLKAEDWKKLKAGHRETVKVKDDEIKKLRLEVEEASKKSSDRSELEALAKERDELQARLETIALEKSPKFQSKYQKSFDRAKELAKKAVGEANSATIAALMELEPSPYRDEQINKIREDLTGVAQGRLDNAVYEMDKARDDKNAELAESKGKLAELEASEKQQLEKTAAQKAEQIEKRIKLTRDVATQSGAFSHIAGDEEHNSIVDSRLEFLDRFHQGKLTDEELIAMPALAKEAEWLSKVVLPTLAEENAKLKMELREYAGANPGVKRSKTPAQGTKSTSPFTDAFLANNPTAQ